MREDPDFLFLLHIFERLPERLLGMAYSAGASRDDAEDIVNESCFKAIRAFDGGFVVDKEATPDTESAQAAVNIGGSEAGTLEHVRGSGHDLRTIEQLLTWLSTIIFRTAADWHKKKVPEQAKRASDFDLLAARFTSPSSVASKREMEKLLEEASAHCLNRISGLL